MSTSTHPQKDGNVSPIDENGWQDIASAPKGARGMAWMLLAYGPSDDQSIGMGMRFNDQFYAASTFYKGGQVGSRQFEFREHEVFPTHWRPIPKPPSTTNTPEIKP